MSHPHSASSLFEHDEQLKNHKALLAKWSKLADDATVAKTVAALQEKHGAKVVVVNTKEEALAAAIAAIPKVHLICWDLVTVVRVVLLTFCKQGASISAAGSTTLTEIGYDEWAKKQTAHRDFKAEVRKKRGVFFFVWSDLCWPESCQVRNSRVGRAPSPGFGCGRLLHVRHRHFC